MASSEPRGTGKNIKYALSKLQSKAGLKPELAESAVIKKTQQKEERKQKKTAKATAEEDESSEEAASAAAPAPAKKAKTAKKAAASTDPAALDAIKTLKAEQYARKLFHLKKTYRKEVKKAKAFQVQKVVKVIKTATAKSLEEELAEVKALQVEDLSNTVFDAIQAKAEQAENEGKLVLAHIDVSSVTKDAEMWKRLASNKALAAQSEVLFTTIASAHKNSLDMSVPAEDDKQKAKEKKQKAKEAKAAKKKRSAEEAEQDDDDEQKTAPKPNKKRKQASADEHDGDDDDDNDSEDGESDNDMFVESLSAAAESSAGSASSGKSKKPAAAKKGADGKPAKRKNRPGQRARQQKHLLKEGMDPLIVRKKVSAPGAGKASVRAEAAAAAAKPAFKKSSAPRGGDKKDKTVHPSWAARMQQKQAQAVILSATPSGKKTTFDD